jgi:hypothetical protein
MPADTIEAMLLKIRVFGYTAGNHNATLDELDHWKKADISQDESVALIITLRTDLVRLHAKGTMPAAVTPTSEPEEPTNDNLAGIAAWRPQGLRGDTLEDALSEQASNVDGLIALYDAYILAAQVFLNVENQPRAGGADDFIETERCRMMDSAFQVAARLASMKTVESFCAKRWATTLFNCALEMGFDLPAAAVVLAEASAVSISKRPPD